MSGAQDLSLYLAFAAGVLSFLSPCVLPLVPSYVAFLTGLSFEELTYEHPKQKMRRIYGVRERQFRNYLGEAMRRRGVTGEALLQLVESRLDNVIYRMGFAVSRPQARELVSHGHFQVNGRNADIPSLLCKAGDEVSVRANSRGNVYFRRWGLHLGFFATGEEIAPPRQTFGVSGFLPSWRDLRCWLDPLCRPDPLLYPALCQHGRGHALGDFTPGFLFFRVRASFFRLFFGPEFLPERLPEGP